MASDGTVGYGTKDTLWLFGNNVYTSNYDGPFIRQLSGENRDNEGWTIYQYNNEAVTTSDSLGKKLTLPTTIIIHLP